MLVQAYQNTNSTNQLLHSEEASPTGRASLFKAQGAMRPPTIEKMLSIRLIFLSRIIEIKAPHEIWMGRSADDLLVESLYSYFDIDFDKFQKLCVIKGKAGSIFKCEEIMLHNGQIFYLILSQRGAEVEDTEQRWLELFGLHSVSSTSLNKIKCSSLTPSWEIYQFEKRGIKAPPLLCPLLNCGKTFKRSCDLISHFNVETNTKPYRCDVCNKRFRRKFMRKLHFAQHFRLLEQQKQEREPRLEQAITGPRRPSSSQQLQLIENALLQLNNCETELAHSSQHMQGTLIPLLQVFKNNLLLAALNQPMADAAHKMKLTIHALQQINKTRMTVLNL